MSVIPEDYNARSILSFSGTQNKIKNNENLSTNDFNATYTDGFKETKASLIEIIQLTLSELNHHKRLQSINVAKQISDLEENLLCTISRVNTQVNYCKALLQEIILIESPQEINTSFQALLSKSPEEAISNVRNQFLAKIYQILPNESKRALELKYNPYYETLEKKELENLKSKLKNTLECEKHLDTIVLQSRFCKTMSYCDDIEEARKKVENFKYELENSYYELASSGQNNANLKHLYESNSEMKDLYHNCAKICKEISKKCDLTLENLSQKEKECKLYHDKNIYLIENYPYDDNEIQTKLVIFDTESLQINYKAIKTPEALSDGTCIAQLPNNELFCYGNYSPLSGVTITINTKDLSFQSLKIGIPCCSSGCTYYQNSVYAFGGNISEENYLNQTRKYDFSEDQWIELSSMPIASDGCSCIPFRESILVSGWNHSKVYRYDINGDIYSEILNISAEKDKIVFTGNSRAYIVEQEGSIYESETNDENIWYRIGNSSTGFALQSYRTYCNGSILIGMIDDEEDEDWDEYYCFYTFNLKSKTLDKIEEICPIDNYYRNS
ncbi:unnamed protein product [Blepharisma stoltei]|uniref:Uncharacterized protein n=1 Tax=Blepharisma stoltei TaxID=1481888 RepID=A0AAU9K764_9CILI|nr:unnamed protein product [Blepharisma stoltei]